VSLVLGYRDKFPGNNKVKCPGKKFCQKIEAAEGQTAKKETFKEIVFLHIYTIYHGS
jgi:hypothetical protein